MAIGVAPETALAKAAGLAVGIRGSIVVNNRMETSVRISMPWATLCRSKFCHKYRYTDLLAVPANKQGRIATDNICGGDSHYTEVRDRQS